MAIRKLLGFCFNNCCGEVCYFNSHIQPLLINTDITYEKCSNTIAERHKLVRAPIILIVKNNAVVSKIIGKVEPQVIIKKLIDIGWTTEKQTPYARSIN